MSRSFVLALAIAAVAFPCLAWNGNEHITIGAEAYHRACADARENEVTTDGRERLLVACRPTSSRALLGVYLHRNVFAYEPLMGEWSALAADHTQTPEQLTSIKLSDMVVDYGLLTRIATTNYRHFQPSSAISWRLYHQQALAIATQAATLQGLAMMEQYEKALSFEAFAQHYLQDSFASGHMGFNRVASSNAAALAYHDEMSKRGRCVRDELDKIWYTYGDDHLSKEGETRERVVSVAAASLLDVIRTFVVGTADVAAAKETWSRFPSFIALPEVTPSKCKNNEVWMPLRSISRPAESVLTFEVSTLVDTSIYKPAPRALLLGFSRDFLYTIPIGYRQIENRLFVNIGTTVTEIGSRSYIGEYGYVWHIGTSAHGALTHEVGFGQLFFYKPTDRYYAYRNYTSNFLYAMNLEAGRVFLRFLGGPSWSRYGEKGLHLSVGIGYVRHSSNAPGG